MSARLSLQISRFVYDNRELLNLSAERKELFVCGINPLHRASI
jgi:hypothetical protein